MLYEKTYRTFTSGKAITIVPGFDRVFKKLEQQVVLRRQSKITTSYSPYLMS